MISAFLAVLIALLVMVIITEIASYHIYKHWLKDSEIAALFDTLPLTQWELNPFDDVILSPPVSTHLFIAKELFSVSTKWYVHGFGRIPRWSQWTKRINGQHKTLLLMNQKSLSVYSAELKKELKKK